jgi:hypothetical protein
MNIFVNHNYIGTIVGVSNDGGATFLMAGTFSNPGVYLIEINTSTDPDPLIDYDLGVSNFGSSSSLFSFATSFDTVGGPYGSTGNQYTLTLDDLGSDGAGALPGGGTESAALFAGEAGALENGGFGAPWFLSGNLGGEPIGDLGDPCFALPGSSTVCTSSFNLFHNLTQGTFTSTVAFQLGPTDRVQFESATVTAPIPEPSVAWLLASGLIAMAGVTRWKRQADTRRQGH